MDEDGETQYGETLEVEKYHRVDKPATPTKLGYTLEGWYTATQGGELYDWNNQITEDTIIYAHWVRNIISYTVRYVDADDESIDLAEPRTIATVLASLLSDALSAGRPIMPQVLSRAKTGH